MAKREIKCVLHKLPISECEECYPVFLRETTVAEVIDNGMADIARNIANETDRIITNMLERAGVKQPYNGDNLAAQGFTLKAETRRIGLDMETKYTLLKEVDCRIFTATGKVEV